MVAARNPKTKNRNEDFGSASRVGRDEETWADGILIEGPAADLTVAVVSINTSWTTHVAFSVFKISFQSAAFRETGRQKENVSVKKSSVKKL